MRGVQPRPQRRVVITGLGVVTPNGVGKDTFWHACINGKSGIKRITRFDAQHLPAQVAGEVDDFEPECWGLTPDEIRTMDRGTQFGLAAANQAWHDARLGDALSAEERMRIGVYMGSAMPYAEEGEKLWVKLTGSGSHEPTLEESESIAASLFMPHASAISIAAHQRLHGPCMVIATGCSAGTDAIGEAFWQIQEGRADCMLAGGTDSAISPMGLSVFCVIGALSTAHNEQPEQASRPYDQKRDGFVMAEGAGLVVLEEYAHALTRGAHIYAEITAFASNSNAYHMTALPPQGEPLQALLQQVLTEADLNYTDLGYINSHGSSTPLNEVAETAAYKAVFGEWAYHIPISATKSMIGHTQGAASAIEAIVTALVLDQQIIPPTLNQEHSDPLCDLDYVPNVARHATVNVALSHSSGFGGVNSVLALARPDWIDSHER